MKELRHQSIFWKIIVLNLTNYISKEIPNLHKILKANPLRMALVDPPGQRIITIFALLHTDIQSVIELS
jgi:hypothetical protein